MYFSGIGEFGIRVSTEADQYLAPSIVAEMESSAKARGTGISRRCPQRLGKIMSSGHAILAFAPNGQWAGFCYMHPYENGKFVSHSGLIVVPEFRNSGLARVLKQCLFQLARQTYPDAMIFGLTTGLAVMKINHELGFQPVTYSQLPQSEEFWNGCNSCVNSDILLSRGRKNCFCTAMLFDPAEAEPSGEQGKVYVHSEFKNG